MTKVSLNGSFKVRELHVRFKPTRYTSPARIGSPIEVHNFLKPIIKGQPREMLMSLALDPANNLVGFEVVSTGTSDASLASPREIFKAVMLTNAVAFIVAHNHPSGNCAISTEDRQIAKKLAHAAQIMDLKMLDFIVVTDDSYYSLAQSDPAAIQPL